MEWVIDPHTRVDIHVWSGINFSGEHKMASVHPAGGRQGSALRDFAFQSIAIAAPIGTRVILCTSVQDDWQERPWRALEPRAKLGFKAENGLPAVRVPDLDWLDKPAAKRTDPDFQQGFTQVASAADRPEWTYGRSGGAELKRNIVAIRVEKLKTNG